jgi:hypothetical protein
MSNEDKRKALGLDKEGSLLELAEEDANADVVSRLKVLSEDERKVVETFLPTLAARPLSTAVDLPFSNTLPRTKNGGRKRDEKPGGAVLSDDGLVLQYSSSSSPCSYFSPTPCRDLQEQPNTSPSSHVSATATAAFFVHDEHEEAADLNDLTHSWVLQVLRQGDNYSEQSDDDFELEFVGEANLVEGTEEFGPVPEATTDVPDCEDGDDSEIE